MLILKDYGKTLFTAFIVLMCILLLLSLLPFFATLEFSALEYGVGLN